MKPQDAYLRFVKWSPDDDAYVGYCPDLFPWGGVCHGDNEQDVYQTLCNLVAEEIESLVDVQQELPPPSTRPMKESFAS